MGVGEDQSDAVASAADPQRLIDLATSVLVEHPVDVLSSLFIIITLLVFLAFDSAKVARLADGARAHRPHLVDALALLQRTAPAPISASRPSSG